MSKIEVNTIAPQSGTTLTVGEAGDTVDISNATLSANLNASSLTSGTIPDARFPATLPALNGSNLTNIQIAGGYTACDSITVTNTDTFALTAGGSPVSPESANNCIVSLNGVIQAPGNSYTISGSNIVFSSALTAGSDVIDFITVLGTALNVGTVSDGTIGVAKLSATGTPSSSTFLRGDNTWQSAGGVNTPAFFVTMSADQSGVADSTFTKVQFNSERFDTNSAYDPTTNYRFTVPAGQGGKYFFSSIILISDAGAQNIDSVDYAFYINGAQNLYSSYLLVSSETALNVSVNGFFNLSAGDYVEMFIYADITGGGTFNINQDDTTKARCFWYGYKIIE